MKERLLDIYSDYLIAQSQLATATGLSALLEGHLSHDQITRFLNKNEFSSKDLWYYVKPTVLQQANSSAVLILDDAIEEKPYTDKNSIVQWYFSHAKHRCVKGINILSCLARYDDVALPIGFEIVHKDLNVCDPKTGREFQRSTVTKNELARGLIKQALVNQVPFEHVLADNWFSSKETMTFIHYEMKKKFVLGLKSNRLVALVDGSGKRGQYQNLNELNPKNGQVLRVALKNCSIPLILITKIFKNEDGSTGHLYIVTNDLDKDTDRIYEIYQKRWRIEEYHKSSKQNSSLEKSPTRTLLSQKNHLFASLIGYCKLECLKLKTALNHFALKYKLILRANRAAYLELQKLRESTSSA